MGWDGESCSWRAEQSVGNGRAGRILAESLLACIGSVGFLELLFLLVEDGRKGGRKEERGKKIAYMR